ncbi:MarR family winged helix-turn-helix transcriptional regulator [Streptomyces sp. AB3(2024)]|uniref:MarR family winged helix-turn-helix transcriptional regulator n=1 Tax=Streptomyces sp. AB3(2024) TaxID=3317321 RepID=UPI0035A3533F
MTTPSRLKPIGYYLKHLDDLINREFDGALAASDLTRRHWQVLHTLAGDGPQDPAGLTARLLPFWGQDAITLDEVASGLTARGWIALDPGAGTYALTASGDRGHADAERLVMAARDRTAAGVTDEEYLGAVTVLARMCANLEGAG